MHGDFTRLRFESDRPYTRVRQLQGRVGLDADWNTHADLQHDLDATTRVDVIGECGAPIHAPGFKIEDATAGAVVDLKIGKGRFYAHGLLVELPKDVSYLKQSYLPSPPPLAAPGSGVSVVYLEVWERHVTAVEDPAILDPALDGRDTSSRVETAWQVKVAPVAAGATCATAALPDPGPGKGTLTTHPVVPPPTDDPCLLDPKGGYRGLDNRLYRVEVHAGGNVGAATFKWSRDNGSVVYPLAEPPAAPPPAATTLTVKLPVPPRDEVLALHAGEWVELLDDHAEYLAKPGPVLRVKDVVPAPDGVNVVLELPAGPAPALPAGPHPKVRRWDGNGVTATAAGKLPLEEGIEVEFGGSGLRPGDYWTFTARANGNFVEKLTAAPPQGVARYLCKLAVVTWAGGKITAVADCRKLFPPLTELPEPTGTRGCCTITVGDGKDSQGDVNSLADAVKKAQEEPPGTVRVCVLPGRHAVPAGGLVITRRDPDDLLILTGCGPASRIDGGDGPAVVVRGADGVVVEKLWVRGNPAVRVGAENLPAARVTVRDCDLVGVGDWSIQAQAHGLTIRDNRCPDGIAVGTGTRDALVADNRVGGGSPRVGIYLGGELVTFPAVADVPGLVRVTVRGNHVRETLDAGIVAFHKLPGNPDEAVTPVLTDLDIVGNRVEFCGFKAAGNLPFPPAGVAVSRATGVRVEGNVVRDCGRVPVGGAVNPVGPAVGILAVAVGHLVVAGNAVADNGLPAVGGSPEKRFQGGIVVVEVIGGTPAGKVTARTAALLTVPGQPAARVHDNRVSCPQGPALLVTGLGPVAVTDNVLASGGPLAGRVDGVVSLPLAALWGAAVGVAPSEAVDKPALDSRLLFQSNQVTFAPPEQTPLRVGCVFWCEPDLTVSGNQFLARSSQDNGWTHVLIETRRVAGSAVQVHGNRFREEPPGNEGVFSLDVNVPQDGPALVALNQVTHRLRVAGTVLAITPAQIATPNQRVP